MTDALIGHSGLVGSTLQRQARFDARYRSTDIATISGRSFETVVCAGAPARKWLANREPEADRANLEVLMAHLETVRCATFVLISTVDVFQDPVGVDEGTEVTEAGLQAYGAHRRLLEKFVADRFQNHLIVRLPGLVGPGLRKNVIYDFLHENDVASIDSRGVFQFYPLINLWSDVQHALHAGLRLAHLTAEPLSVAAVARAGFGKRFESVLAGEPARYDLRTRHAEVFGARGFYQYTARETVQAIRDYARSEPTPSKSSGASG